MTQFWHIVKGTQVQREIKQYCHVKMVNWVMLGKFKRRDIVQEHDIFSLLQRFHIWSWTQAAYPSRSYVYDVTDSCVMLRWFSKPSKPTPSWFKPQLSYLLLANGIFSRHWPMTTTPGPSWLKNGFWHDAPLSLLPQVFWICRCLEPIVANCQIVTGNKEMWQHPPNKRWFHMWRSTQGCVWELCAKQILAW